MSASLFCRSHFSIAVLVRSAFVAAEDAEFAGGFAYFREGLVQVGSIFCFQVNEELVFPGAAVNRAAFNLQQIYSMFCERLEGGKERTRPMREAHGEGSFAGILCEPRARFFFRHKKYEACEILRVVLDALGKYHAVIMLGCAASGDRGARLISGRDDLADAARSVFGRNALPLRMCGKKTLTLCQCHGMRSYGTDVVQRSTWQRDELHLDGQNCFRYDGEPAFQKKIKYADHRPGK